MIEAVNGHEAARNSFLQISSLLHFSSPLFSVLARECAADRDMLELGAFARQGQPAGVFVLFAAQYLLLHSPNSPLARYFPSLTESPEPADSAFPVFREFCVQHRAELRALLTSRTVNTNFVERASCIMPSIGHVASVVGKPFTLVEMCCSAGLNLLFDEYHYDYGPEGRVGKEASQVRLECRLIGARPPIDNIPRVSRRVGVDLVAIDPTASVDRSWMEAMLCPEWHEERRHLREALSVRALHGVQTIAGDALAVMPPLLEEIRAPVCVLHTYCMGQWSADAQQTFDGILRDASRSHEIHRVGIEVPEDEAARSTRLRLAKLAAAGFSLSQKSLPSRIEYTHYVHGHTRSQVLGHADGFGAWLDWHPDH
jgi:hypothetical protein